MLEGFQNKTILVIGDIMLDKYTYGSVERVSPEAPVPILTFASASAIPGGAANVANNIASLGAKAIVCGIIGRDDNADLLIALLKKSNIGIGGIIIDESRPTTVKQRVISGSQQLLRIDYEESNYANNLIEQKLIDFIKSTMSQVNGVLISDYAKGVVAERLIRETLAAAKHYKKPIVGCPKPRHAEFFREFDLLTQNLKEAAEITKSGGSDSAAVERMGRYLVAKLRSNIFITRGAEGISLFEKSGMLQHFPTKRVRVFDVSGAGDTVAAVSILSLSCGFNLADTARLANKAGNLVVQKPGTATLTLEELNSMFRDDIGDFLREGIEVKEKVLQDQIGKIDQIVKLLVEAYKNGRKVLTFGNGGSATDAQHFVGEIVGRFKLERKAFPAMALTCDSAVVTAIANDYGYDKIFERQVEAAAQPGDIVVGITTSGKSQNVLNGLKKAKELEAKTIGLTGKDGGELPNYCDVCLIVPSNNTPRIQETHMVLIHIICELLEKELTKTQESSNNIAINRY